MPTSEKQRRAAGAELGRRREGAKRQDHATRPFGSASTSTLRDFASKPAAQPRKKRDRD